MDAIMNSANTNAKVKEATEKLMNEVDNSTVGIVYIHSSVGATLICTANYANHSGIKSLSF